MALQGQIGQIQHNGTVPIAPQPPGMPPADSNAPFTVTAVTYAALPPNDHYSARLTSTAGGKAFGYLTMGLGIIYDSASQTLDISNQFSPAGSATGLQVMATDGPNQAGIYNDGVHGTRCFVQTPAGFSPDARFSFPLGVFFTSANVFATGYASACAGVDNGVAVGTAYNQIFNEVQVHEGFLSELAGYSQTAFAGNLTLGAPDLLGHFLVGCCSRARGIHGNQVVGDITTGGGIPLSANPLGLDSSMAGNPNSIATLWLLSAPSQGVQLAPPPSIALATNGWLQGGWASGHAAIWSGDFGSMVDLNPPGYFDSRVTGVSAEFQVGDGWLGGPANTPGAAQHALLWKGSAASVVDLNQFLPFTIFGATINGVDQDGNIVGSMLTFTGQEYGLYFTPNPSQSLASLAITPANPAPGNTLTGIVTLRAPAGAGGVLVSFTTDDASLVPGPAPVLVPAGQTSASFSVAVANQFLPSSETVTLTAHAGFTAKSAAIGVVSQVPADPLASFTLATSTAAPGDTVNLQLTLTNPAPADGVTVSFSSSNPNVVPAPITAVIPQGAVSLTTSVVTNSTALFQPVTLALQAQTGKVILSANLTVESPSNLTAVELGSPQNGTTSAPGNSTGVGFIPFTAVATSAGTVTLSSGNPALVVPPSVSFAAGDSYASFAYAALPVAALTTAALSASSNGVTVSANISVLPSTSPSIQTLAIPVTSPTKTYSSGQTLTGTITLTGPAFLGGMTVALATDTPSVVQIPASVIIPANTTSATFLVSALSVAGPATVTITATLAGFPAVLATITIIPGPALSITHITLAPYSMIGPGVTTTGTFTLNQPAPAGGVTLTLSSGGATAAKLPASVSIPAGQSSASVTLQGNGVSAVTALLLTASYSGVLAPIGTSASIALTVAPTDVLKAPKPTWSTSTHLLTATCTSTNAQSVVAVLNAAGNAPLGTMTNLGNGNYSFQMTIASISSVNFRSDLGGATGQGVAVVP